MKEVAKHDRPREKLQRLGVAALGDNELVAIVLGSGSRQSDALELANRLLERAGGLHGLTRTAPDQLCVRASASRARRRLRRRSSWGVGRWCEGERASALPDAATAGLLPVAAVRRRDGRTVRHRDARHEAPRHPHQAAVNRLSRCHRRAPARSVQGGDGSVGRGHRVVPQSPVRRSDAEQRRSRA